MSDRFGSEDRQQELDVTAIDLDGVDIDTLRNMILGTPSREGEVGVAEDSAVGDFDGMAFFQSGSAVTVVGGRANVDGISGEVDLTGYQYGSALPDSALYQYPIRERTGGSTTIEEQLEDEDATANGTTNVSGSWWEGWAEDGDGSSDYIAFPAAIGNWIQNADAEWLAFTVDIGAGDINRLMGWDDATQSPSELWLVEDASISGSTTDGMVYRLIDSGDNSIVVETDNAVFDGSKHRFVIQRTGAAASDVEIWRDGSQEDTSIVSSGTTTGSYSGSPDSDGVFFLARSNEGSATDFSESAIDNIIFGERGTTLSSSEISDDYNNQPWS